MYNGCFSYFASLILICLDQKHRNCSVLGNSALPYFINIQHSIHHSQHADWGCAQSAAENHEDMVCLQFGCCQRASLLHWTKCYKTSIHSFERVFLKFGLFELSSLERALISPLGNVRQGFIWMWIKLLRKVLSAYPVADNTGERHVPSLLSELCSCAAGISRLLMPETGFARISPAPQLSKWSLVWEEVFFPPRTLCIALSSHQVQDASHFSAVQVDTIKTVRCSENAIMENIKVPRWRYPSGNTKIELLFSYDNSNTA